MAEPESDKTTFAPTELKGGGPASSKALPEEVAALAADASRRVGKYVTVKPLGAGGMGVVVKAYDTELHRWVALKFLKAAGDEDARATFLREAQVAAKLSHPNIAAIYGVGDHAGQPYIAMQFVDGENLHAARKKMSIPQVVDAVRKVADALRHAHEQRIIHRDLKPANVMVDVEGRIFVMDFGLAKETAVDGKSVAGSGAIVGTPSYMSPEQAKGKADAQSDVYGLGATLYDLLTQRAPFVGETAADIMAQIVSQDPVTPRKLNPGVPADLEAITLRAIERDRSRRYRNVDDLIADLEAFRAGDPLKFARRLTWSYVLRKRIRRQPLPWALGAALLLAVAGGAAFGAYGLVRAAAEAEGRAKVEREGRERTEAQREKAEDRLAAHYVSLGGRSFEAGDAATAAVYFAEAAAARPTAAHRAAAAAALEGPVRLRSILPGGHKPPLLMSPDGRRVFSAGDEVARIWDAESGALLDGATTFSKPVYDAALSPDGRRIVIGVADHSAHVFDLELGHERLPPLPHDAAVRWVRWSGDGRRIVTASADKTLRIWDPEKGALVAGPLVFPAGISSLELSPEGRTAAIGQGDGTLSFLPLDDPAAPPEGEKQAGGRITFILFSPDGSRVLVSGGEGVLRFWDVAQRRPMNRDLKHESRVMDAKFSPDGSRIFVACGNGAVRIWDGTSGDPVGGLTHPDLVGALAVHPTHRLLLSASRDAKMRIWSWAQEYPKAVVVPHEATAALLAITASGDRVAVGGREAPACASGISTGPSRTTSVSRAVTRCTS